MEPCLKNFSLYNEDPSMTNNIFYPSSSIICGKEPQYNKTLL